MTVVVVCVLNKPPSTRPSVLKVLCLNTFANIIHGIALNAVCDNLIQVADMIYRNLGKSGLRVSCIGLGTWTTFGNQISDELAENLVTIAYENGVNLFDCAEVYAGGKAEIILGSILKKKKWRRSSYIISTKLFWGGMAETERGLSRKHIIEGLHGSLKRLQLSYVDIVFANKYDPNTDMLEIVRAFTFLINQGLAMYWGTSRWTAAQIMEACLIARQFNLIEPVAEQAEYNFFQREFVEVQIPSLAEKLGIGSLSWSPLAGGIISGKYMETLPAGARAGLNGFSWLKERIFSEAGRCQQADLKKIQIIADRLGCTLAQLAIAWCLRYQTNSGVLIGATSVEQLYENLKSLNLLANMSADILKVIDDTLGNAPS